MQLLDLRGQPIIQWIGAYGAYPFDALAPAVASELYKTATQISCPSDAYLVPRIMPLLRLIECYLQISGQRLDKQLFGSAMSITILREFVGALYSPGFADFSPAQRFNYVSTLNYLNSVASATRLGYPQPKIVVNTRGATEEIASLTALAENRVVDPHKVWLWSNWPSTNKAGKVTWHPLFHIYKRFGMAFTKRFYDACDRFFSARRADKIDGLKQFCIFVGNSPKAIHPDSFNDSQFATAFLKDFCWHFFNTGHAANSKIQTLKDQWQTFAETFVKGELIPSAILNIPLDAVPIVGKPREKSSSTHIVTTSAGNVIKTKLVTPIPLYVSEPVAIEMLFHEIRRDFDILLTWAKTEINDIWARFCRRRDLAIDGEIRQIQRSESSKRNIYDRYQVGWAVSRANPDHLANAAATFKHHGFLTGADAPLGLLFPRPLEQTAHELALPTVQALLPHCTLLTAMHPKITPAFLETLELYDKNGKKVGININDQGTYLVGYKRRKGPSYALQVVLLNEETASVVQQIIEITAPLRNYLKERGDDNWRYLLLSCGQGFKYPGRIKRLASDTSIPRRLLWLAERLVATTGIDLIQAQQLAKRFSLPALRASAGVLVYLETKNSKAMAQALGHTTYDPHLLQHYLPEPILSYFQDRWIRLFQTGIIIEAMKESDFLVEASGFSSMDEVDQFLQNHALRPFAASQAQGEFDDQSAQANAQEIVFGLSAGILTILLSLVQAVDRAKKEVNKRAHFWAELGRHLVSHIEASQSDRPDLLSYLKTAREKANPDLMEQMVYA